MSTDFTDDKKRRATIKSTKAVVDDDGRRVTPVSRLPAARAAEAPPCPLCACESTYIYATRTPTRFCKCRQCGHSYKHVILAVDSHPIDDIHER